jgi:GT2 family glycosyltransferase
VKPLVTAAIIGWNGGSDIEACLQSLLSQTVTATQTIVVDNGSTDGSVERLKALDPGVEVIANSTNLGFARAANQAFEAATGEWLLLVNQDVVLDADYLRRLLEAGIADSTIGSITGKLLLHGAGRQVIDTAGHVLYRNGWAANRGEHDLDTGQFDRAQEVFGVCAAAALYRVAMLRDACEGTARPFDERFFAFIEDVDLDWRARWLGWRAWYVPVEAWHRRGGSGAGYTPRQLRRTVANRLMVVANNDLWPGGLFRAPGAAAFAVAGVLRSIRHAPGVLLGPLDVLRSAREIRSRRRFIAARRRVSQQSMARWMQPYPFLERAGRVWRRRSARRRLRLPHTANPPR